MPSPSTLIVCDRCGVPRPESQFRWRKVGQNRHTDCNFCHSRREASRVALKRQTRRDRGIARGCRAIARADDVRDIQRLARILLDKFHGPRCLATKLHETIQAAKPGSQVVANALLTVMQIQVAASVSADTELPATLESRREALTREFTDFLLEQIHDRSEEHAELLRAAGWKVEPPQIATMSHGSSQPLTLSPLNVI